jgi:cation transport ATPase
MRPAGDVFRITETELVPADGRIVAGNGAVEESSLTGEPLPITKKPGDFIRSGARIQQGRFKIKAEKVGSDSTLGQMMQVIEKTLLTKLPIEGKTDIILQWFVPGILMLAAATGIVCRLIGLSLETSILRAVTVMVISCPCALGIAIPLARVAGISIAGKKGILVRNFAAFEMAKRITAVVFDKTGTVTHGNWALQEIVAFAPFDENQALKLAAGLEKNSDHFIGREILRQARIKKIQPAKLRDIRTEENGISGQFEGKVLRIGSTHFHFLGDRIDVFTKQMGSTNSGQTSKNSYVFMSSADQPAAIFIFGDTIRKGINATVQNLQHRGLQIALVSGDGQETTGAVATDIGASGGHGGRWNQ